MRIEDEKLIALLVNETGQSKGKVKDQLDQLKNRIMRAARTGGVVEISDFGTFATKNSILDFKPSKQLKTEINQKYAGMRAIELMEAYKAGGPEVPVDERRYEPPVPSASDKIAPETNRYHSRRKSEKKVSRRAAGQTNENNGDFEQKWKEQQEKDKDNERAHAYREQAIKDSGQPEFQEERRQNNRPPEPEPYAGNRDDEISTPKLFVAALTAAAIILAGWLLYESGMIEIPGLKNRGNAPIAADTVNQTENQAPTQTQTQSKPGTESQIQPQSESQPQTTALPPVASDSAAAAASASNTEEESASENSIGNAAGNQQFASESYGLKGQVDEGLSGEFTIVVHSFRLKSTVEDLAVELKQDGYRTVLSESVAEDGTRWRLGLGQFPTEEAAEKAAQTLPEPYINNYFVDQI